MWQGCDHQPIKLCFSVYLKQLFVSTLLSYSFRDSIADFSPLLSLLSQHKAFSLGLFNMLFPF